MSANGADQTRAADAESGGTRTRNQLWIEWMARQFKFDRLGDRLFGRPTLAPYLFFGAVVVLSAGVLSTFQYLQWGYHPYLVNPSAVLSPLGVFFGIWASRRMRQAYEDAVAALIEADGVEQFQAPLGLGGRVVLWFGADSDSDDLEAILRSIVSNRLKAVLLLAGWGFHASWILFNPEVQTFIFETSGTIIGPIKHLVVTPLVIYVVGVDFMGVYVGAILLVPLKLRSTGLINFQDPLGFGQLKPVGHLIKSGTLYYFAGAGAYVLFKGLTVFFARQGAPIPGTTTVATYGITLILVVGVVLFVLPILITHGHMKQAKHRKIQQLAADVQRHGPEGDEMMFPETQVPDTIEEGQEYLHYFIKMTKVENTREYPVDISHLQEFVLAALVPYIAHVTVTFLLSYSSGGGH